MSERQKTANHDQELIALRQAIRARRLERGLRIEALARKAGMSADHLDRIERGHCTLTALTLRDLARALDIPASVLFREAERDAEHKEAAHARQTR